MLTDRALCDEFLDVFGHTTPVVDSFHRRDHPLDSHVTTYAAGMMRFECIDNVHWVDELDDFGGVNYDRDFVFS